MKNINMTREQAINNIIEHIQNGCSIPMVSLGNGGAGFDFINTNEDLDALNADLINTDKYTFRVVPISEIAEDFEENIKNLDNYDVCVEFASTIGDNPYREQFLLWND